MYLGAWQDKKRIILSRLKNYIGDTINYEILQVDHIERGRNAKYKFVINNMRKE